MQKAFRMKYGNSVIQYCVSLQDRKSLSISVHPNMIVEIKAPLKATRKQIEKRLQKRAPWILKQLNYFEGLQPLTPSRKYINGETHLYLGKQLKLKIRKSIQPNVKIQNGYIIVNTNPQHNQQQIIHVIEEWYNIRAKLIIGKIYGEMIKEFHSKKLIPRAFQIRKMKKRWGSCTPGKKIILNSELIKAPKNCIKYVIIHELCHLKYPNHSNKFYQLQSYFLPNWEFWKNKLELIMS
jgi:predicted metal-dependent hydrolase